MQSLNKTIGVILILIAAGVAIHTVIEPLYHTSDPNSDNPHSSVWGIINPISAISLILGLIFSYIRINKVGDNSSIQEFIAANTLFYGFMFAAIIFFWNWFGILNAKTFTAVGDESRSTVWIIFDATLPLLNGALGAHLLRNSGGE
ncbi:MAG: hypothetical protein OXD54_17575 [Candidatus Poribacteria bacterium]|nr:hypothetical protein [Candidatus Poribacteria bacterium]